MVALPIEKSSMSSYRRSSIWSVEEGDNYGNQANKLSRQEKREKLLHAGEIKSSNLSFTFPFIFTFVGLINIVSEFSPNIFTIGLPQLFLPLFLNYVQRGNEVESAPTSLNKLIIVYMVLLLQIFNVRPLEDNMKHRLMKLMKALNFVSPLITKSKFP